MVVGIDYDTHALYLCAYTPGDDPALATARLRSSRDSNALEAIGNVPSALGRALDTIHNGHADLWVERGRGANRNADWILGAIAGAVIATYPRLNGGSARLIDANQWKATIGARGNTKAAANHAATLQWSSRHPHLNPPTDPNLLDAYGIALAASTR